LGRIEKEDIAMHQKGGKVIEVIHGACIFLLQYFLFWTAHLSSALSFFLILFVGKHGGCGYSKSF